MAFSFHAAGTRDQVITQLRGVTSKDLAGELAARLTAEVLSGDGDCPPGPGLQVCYVVKASGHSGGGLACALHLTVEALAVPAAEATG